MLIRSPELFGRAGELRELGQALERALAGHGGAVFLVGESGIGKSRLARELAARAAERGVRVLRGHSSAIGPAVPFRPLAEALLALARDTEPVDVGDLGLYQPALGVLVPDWRGSAPDEPAPPLLVVAEAVLRLLTAVGRAGGCMLVLDDLHDADAETLFVLEYLVNNLGAARVLLISTIQDGSSAARDIARSGARHGACSLRTLRRLTRDDVHGMVAACLGTEHERVPAATATSLWQLSSGNPLLLEELLHELVHERVLTERPDGWHLAGRMAGTVPAALVSGIAARTAKLGSAGGELLAAAAVLGPRFPAPVVQRIAGADDRTVAAFLGAAVDAQLVEPDPAAFGWYVFGHPLTAEAVLARLSPTRRAELARQAADTTELLYPGLPGDWCTRAARLRQLAGDRIAAGRLFADAGHRALAAAAADRAVTLLEQADALLADSPDLPLRGTVLESLVYALGETGQTDRAFALTSRFSDVGLFDRAAVLHARVAWAAHLAGRTDDGLAQVTAARIRLGPGGDRERAAVDAVHALLLLDAPGRAGDAGALAAAALEQAERTDDPVAAVPALLGLAALTRDPARARDHLERARQLTETHGIPLWRTHVMLRLGELAALAEGDTGGLELARGQAERSGAAPAAQAAEAHAILHGLVLRGEFHAAAERLGAVAGRAHVIRAVRAAHQADRAGMAEAIGDFRAASGDHHPDLALCLGLAQAFCALLEEDRDQARRDLKRARIQAPGGAPLAGQHGLELLLDILAGDLEADEPARAATAAESMFRWNRQFAALAEAVLHGRHGDTTRADNAAKEAREAALPYRMAGHLGARLVAEAALADGWGDPVTWLRAAEEYFHDAEIPAVAGACRTLLRRAGESVRQRRPGLHRLPRELRDAGVTVREYDVFRLLAYRLGNTDIARRLLISPKTVEKHVSSLMAKTKLPDRVTLFDYAATISR
ncbi:AAA family ATPase [Amycolatopsis sp. NPDC051102]|uniref:helix-turn-helix transcriptional regulator n=1 Tax=Amycolatopsis sp. NPDC051102 TaxID=3155163 RepID=UPI0034143D7B